MDATSTAIRTQMAALGGGPFEVGVLHPDSGMQLRTWEAADVLKSVSWMKAKNAEGAAIFSRPAGEHGFSLIDDVKPDVLPRLKGEGFQPCLVVETSPNNYQTWLNHGRVLPKEASSAVARALAEKFGGDLGSADWRHFGRLAGFTNQKEKHRMPNGLFPFVRIVESHPFAYPQAETFVGQVEQAMERAALAQARAMAVSRTPRDRIEPATKGIADFHADARYGGDLNRADLAYTIYALGRGVPEADIRNALTARDLSTKGGPSRIEDYMRRPIAKAVEHLKRGPVVLRGPSRVRELGR